MANALRLSAPPPPRPAARLCAPDARDETTCETSNEDRQTGLRSKTGAARTVKSRKYYTSSNLSRALKPVKTNETGGYDFGLDVLVLKR